MPEDGARNLGAPYPESNSIESTLIRHWGRTASCHSTHGAPRFVDIAAVCARAAAFAMMAAEVATDDNSTAPGVSLMLEAVRARTGLFLAPSFVLPDESTAHNSRPPFQRQHPSPKRLMLSHCAEFHASRLPRSWR